MSKSSKSDKKKKKHHATTPETLPSPTHDSESGKIDVLNDDEIQGFAIRQEELDKLRKELETKQKAEFDLMEAKRQNFAVRKPVPSKKRLKHERLLVARTAPEAAKQRELDYSGPAGPKYTAEGHVVDYSLLGSVEDFVEAAVKNEDMLPEAGPAMLKTLRKFDVGSYDAPDCSEEGKLPQQHFDQTRALHRWDMHMRERRRQQDYLTRLTDKPVEELAMNQDLDERNKFETRRMIERVGPLYAPTRHHRDGLEFWKQEETIGNADKGGLRLTLPRSERGFPFYYEHIKKPRSQLVETGQRGDYNVDTDDSDDGMGKYRRGVYLRKRWIELAPTIHEIDPHQKLDCTDLEINVRKSKQDLLNAQADYNEFQEEIDECTPLTPDQLAPLQREEDEENDPLAAYPDQIPKIYDGPALLFNNHLARWNGSSDADQDQVGLEVRMNFLSSIEGRDIMKLKIENRGTTSLHYEWHRIPSPPKFDNITLDHLQRFYFNIGHGVILPGDVREIPFTFKSPNAGIFQEKWSFRTEPTLMGGASLLLVLKGVATQERHRAEVEKMCEVIERRLERVEGEETVGKVIDDLIRSVRTPERCASPLGAHMSEEQQFKLTNPKLHFHHQTVHQLKRINAQLVTGRYGNDDAEEDDDVTESVEWNMSIGDLRRSAYGALADIDARERCLAEINALVSRRLVLPVPIPITDVRYNATTWALQCFLDEMTSCSMHLRHVMGIPQLRMAESLASVYQEESVLQRALSEAAAAHEEASKAEKNQQSGKGKGKDKKDNKKDKKEPVKSPTPKSRPASRQQQQSDNDEGNENDDEDDDEDFVDDAVELEVDEETMDKYRTRFHAFTRQLLVDTLDRIFDFFEAN